MHILVTGSAGFIGSHLCQKLLARGDEVVGIDNFDPYYAHEIKQANLDAFLHEDRFEFRQTDIRQGEEVAELFSHHRPFDAIVHLAAKAGVRPSIADPLGYAETNLTGTLHLLGQAAAQSTPPKFIFGSSSSVYGDNAKAPFAETDPVDQPISPYAATKKAGELLCHTFHHLHGIPTFCLRFFTVYGPRQRPDLAIRKFAERMLASEPVEMFGDGTMRRDYTWIGDILDGLVAAVDRCEGYEIINLGSEHPIGLTEMIETLAAALGTEPIINHLPDQPGDVRQTYADIARARELLDYEPTMDFAEGIERFVEWLRPKG